MITPFGKELRKIRIDKNLLLKNMADDLGFTSSYLSAIENGKKKIPEKFIEVLTEKYHLTSDEKSRLEVAEVESQSTLEFNLKKMNEPQREFLFAFARRFEELPDEALEKMTKKLEQEDADGL